MPDLNHSIDEHRENLRGWCSSPRHIAARKIQVEKHPLCSRCGRPATCVLHEYPDDYRHGYDHYVGLVERGERPTGCNTCNRMEQSGRRACPSCCENYKKDPTTKIHYITQSEEICHYCQPEYDPETAKVRHEQGNRIKRELRQGGYIKAHPTKQAIVGGKWVEIKR